MYSGGSGSADICPVYHSGRREEVRFDRTFFDADGRSTSWVLYNQIKSTYQFYSTFLSFSIAMTQVNDPHTQVGVLQSDVPALREYEQEQDHEQKDRDLEPSSPTVGDDEKPSEVDSGSYLEVERNIGVTKIEALYIVFGKGWKLVMLWLYVLLLMCCSERY
jgi:hypothetical protein